MPLRVVFWYFREPRTVTNCIFCYQFHRPPRKMQYHHAVVCGNSTTFIQCTASAYRGRVRFRTLHTARFILYMRIIRTRHATMQVRLYLPFAATLYNNNNYCSLPTNMTVLFEKKDIKCIYVKNMLYVIIIYTRVQKSTTNSVECSLCRYRNLILIHAFNRYVQLRSTNFTINIIIYFVEYRIIGWFFFNENAMVS